MGLLNIYLANQEQLTTLNSDLVTQYPSTNTGLPTAFANPGPVIPFNQEYSATQTYLAYIQAATNQQYDQLTNSFNKTNLDIENPGVAGGPNADTTTQYPPLVTGTPTNTQNPGGPITNFNQPYLPSSTYLDSNPIQGLDSGQLSNTLEITNLDTENLGVAGGPNVDITTQYPSLITGTPTNTQNPGGPLTNFDQPYTPSNTYLDLNPIQGINSGRLSNTLEITNLDVENPGVAGGPNTDITTQYPPLITGTPTNTQNPGGPLTNFNQPYLPSNTYLNSNPIQGIDSGQLSNTLEITNLDVENPGVQGGPNADTTTQYPPLVTGTPTNTQNPGGPLTNFDQPYTPSNTYLDSNPIQGLDSGQLSSSLEITNLDIENPGVQGGPFSDITTVYPVLTTGTPTLTANPGGPPTNFLQPYLPSNTYLDTNPIQGVGSGKLDNTLAITNLDVENPGVNGGPLNDTTTSYPASVTGTPTSTANPGGPIVNFSQPYLPSNTYLDPSYNVDVNNTLLNNTLNITNLDVEDPGVQGGIPYRSITDPTIYPTTTTATSEIRGFYPFLSKPAAKYGTKTSPSDVKVFTPQDTYLNYIENYI